MFNKSAIFTSFILLLLTHNIHLCAEENPFAVKFPIKEGLIHYVVRGSNTGTKLLYFKEYGKKQLIVEQIEENILHQQQSAHKVTLINSDEKYIIDIRKGEAVKAPLLQTSLYNEFKKLTSKEQEKILENIHLLKNRSWQNSEGLCILHAKKVAGIWCNEERIDGRFQCSVARGTLILDSKVDILGYHVRTFATSIEEKEIKSSSFVLPKNLKIVKTKTIDNAEINTILHHLLKTDKSLLCHAKTALSDDKEEFQKIIYEEIQNLSNNF